MWCLPLAVGHLVPFLIEMTLNLPEVAGSVAGFVSLVLIAIVFPERACRRKETPYAFSWGRSHYKKFRKWQAPFKKIREIIKKPEKRQNPTSSITAAITGKGEYVRKEGVDINVAPVWLPKLSFIYGIKSHESLVKFD